MDVDQIDLAPLLQRLRNTTADKTMEYIHGWDESLSPTEKERFGSYEKRILAKLRTIRHKYTTASMQDERIKCIGTIRPADSMCLFVCGLLPYPGMSFSGWVSSDKPAVKAYADAFFEYMMGDAMQNTIQIYQTLPVTDDDLLNPLLTDTTKPAPGYICAETLISEDMHALHAKNVLILDAFSPKPEDLNNQALADHTFLQYHPVVWHLHCLWLYSADNTLCCYAAKTGSACYIFIGNYEDHVNKVKADANTDRNKAVLELVVRPLKIYQMSHLNLTATHEAVISRSQHQDNFQYYMPLTYVHLYVHPKPVYLDTNFAGTDIESMLAFVVGRGQNTIIQTLPYTPQNSIIFTLPAAPPANAYAQLAASHHALMKAHAFVIPDRATEEEILFDPIDAPGHSKHLDYIGALCTVRYNWVFDLKSRHADIRAIKEPAADAPCHEIDVYRHIIHLNSSDKTGPSKVLKPLYTGCYVQDVVTKRKGVIVFDVQERGRGKYFQGHEHFNDLLHAAGLSQMVQNATDDCYTTCTKFGIDAAKTSDYCVVDAMKTYFNPHDKWTLCDMAYKYVVRAADDTYFMQDSFTLDKDIRQTTTTETFARCPFCPVCFDDVQDAHQPSCMYYHIRDTHTQFPIADIAHIAGRPASPRVMEELIASDSSDPPNSKAPSHSSADVDFEEGDHHGDTDKHVEKCRELLLQLSRIRPQDFTHQLEAHDQVAANTIDQWKRKYETLKGQLKALNDGVQTRSTESLTLIKQLEEALAKLTAAFRNREAESAATTAAKLDLQKELQRLSEEHTRKQDENIEKEREMIEKNTEERRRTAQEHNEKMQKAIEKHDELEKVLQKVHDENQKKHDETNTKLAEALQNNLTHNTEVEALQRQVQEKNKRIAELEAALAALRLEEHTAPPAPPPADDTALRAAEQQVRALQAELEAHKKYARNLQADVARLKAQIAEITSSLQSKVTKHQAGLTDLKQTISRNTQRQISKAVLMQLLIAKDYRGIRAAVEGRAALPRTNYSTAAVFLHLESMGATWKMHLDNEARLQVTDDQKKAVMDRRHLVLEQMLYDLTLWFSMLNDVKTRYCSAHVAAFIRAFDLRPDEVTGNEPEASSDDEDA